MFEKLRPLGSRVLVKRIEQPEQEGGLIVVPDSAKEKAQTGQVVAVGGGRLDKSGTLVPLHVKVGDIVYIGKYSGTELGSKAGNDYVIIHEDDILGIVEK